MRLIAIDFDSDRLFNQVLNIRPLTVLFGANSCGKTTVLESVEQILTRRNHVRFDRAIGPSRDPLAGYVTFDLDQADVPGHSDAEFERRLKTSLTIGPDTPGAVDFSAVLAGATTADSEELLAEHLARDDAGSSKQDRELLARALLRSRVFYSTIGGTYLEARTCDLRVDARSAAERIARTPGTDDDLLCEMARSLARVGYCAVGLSDFDVRDQNTREMFPDVIRLDMSPVGLPAIVQKMLPKIHDRLWRFPDHTTLLDGEPDNYLLNEGVNRGFSDDLWLERMDREGNARVAGRFTSHPTTVETWFRVRSSVRHAAAILTVHANTCLPRFISEVGSIEIEVVPIAAWHAAPERVRVIFKETVDERVDGQTFYGVEVKRDLEVVGAGTARWIVAAVRQACLDLANGVRVIDPRFFNPEGNSFDAERFDEARKTKPGDDVAVLIPRPVQAVYVIDEPEAHLHQRAVRSVAEWLVSLSAGASAVIVATHHPVLLDLPSEHAASILVQRADGHTKLVDIGDDIELLQQAVEVGLGIPNSELLLMTKLFLFVEGPHDVAVLESWFGNELRASGVKVIPLHGTHNAMALVDSEIISALGIRMATLTDNTVRSRVVIEPRSSEEQAVSRLIREALLVGHEITPFGHLMYDIVQLFDDDVCKAHAPSFPGWTTVDVAWNAVGRPTPWKHWVTQTYGLQLHRDAVAEIANACRTAGTIPKALATTIKSIVALASERQVRLS